MDVLSGGRRAGSDPEARIGGPSVMPATPTGLEARLVRIQAFFFTGRGHSGRRQRRFLSFADLF
jgi:hypothetical protein